MIVAFIAFFSEIFYSTIQQNKQNLKKLKQSEMRNEQYLLRLEEQDQRIMEMNETMKDQEAVIAKLHLTSQECLGNTTEKTTTIELKEMCQLIQEIDDDIESEELHAGSYKIRTIAQIHAANNDQQRMIN